MPGRVLMPREVKTTVYLSDLQLQHLGHAHFARNPLIRIFSDVADRNLIQTQTADLFIDESLGRLRRELVDQNFSMCVLGDVADTPTVSELSRFENLLGRHNIPIDVYARGNHSSANAFGIINLTSRFYRFLRTVPFFKHFSLRREVNMAAGGAGNVLTAEGTFEGMHHILHQEESRGQPGTADINVDVAEADYAGYRLSEETGHIPFDGQHLSQTFDTFWRPTKRARLGDIGGSRYWECLVNAHIADAPVGERETKVTPFFIQASEQARFQLQDGSEIPVYNISLDGLDHTHFLALNPALSELQIRVVETLIERMLQENPRARFKFSCHFSASDMLRRPLLFWKGWRAREAFRRLLAREEVILYACGHAHERAVVDLNKSLGLKRNASLTEIRVPSLIDYHPTSKKAPNDPPDARAIVIETLHIEESEPGQARLMIDLEYRGLDRREFVKGYSSDVHVAQKKFREEHGYIRARETNKELIKKHVIGWLHGHLKRFGEVLTVGLNPSTPRRVVRYWGQLSIAKYVIDNFTVASTVNMFNEAYHLLSFLESIIYLIEKTDDSEEMAVKARLEGLRTMLIEDYTTRRHDFELALSQGERPSVLREYNDLFYRTRAWTLPELLMGLKVGGEARAFALWSGISASKDEFKYYGKKPSNVPKVIPSISIPIG